MERAAGSNQKIHAAPGNRFHSREDKDHLQRPTFQQKKVKAEDRALGLQKEELAVNQNLLKQNFVQKTHLMALERGVADATAGTTT